MLGISQQHCLSSKKMFRFALNIFFVFTTTANFFGAEMSVAEIRQELKILPVVTSFCLFFRLPVF